MPPLPPIAMAPLRYRLFGRTGLRISQLFLGAMILDDVAETRRIIDGYAAIGGNVIDTASAYGDSERILGEALADRDRFVLATKYSLSRDRTDSNGAGNHRKNLVLSLEQSLRRLRTDYIDIYWVHIWDPHTPLEETMRALDDAVTAGKVLYVGMSDAPSWIVSRANTLAEWHTWTPFAGIQVPYNLLERDIEREALPMAHALGLTVAAWGPMAHGVLAGSTNRVNPQELTDRQRGAAAAVRSVADEIGATPAQVAIAWTMARSGRIHPILGTRTAQQVTANAEALTLELPEEKLRQLERAAPFEQGPFHEFIAASQDNASVVGDHRPQPSP